MIHRLEELLADFIVLQLQDLDVALRLNNISSYLTEAVQCRENHELITTTSDGQKRPTLLGKRKGH
jgi:hypothetical protein